ncbi:hypothetical protein CEQ90_16630 [Lewinellaceae bacterium SD302]|nr:hypothetical protein CEQ90_16630 [Lewinellaceae bacterium SD302]
MLERLKNKIILILGGYPPEPGFSAVEYFNILMNEVENESMILSEPSSSYGGGSSKSQFIEGMKKRYKTAAIKIINLIESTPGSPGIRVMGYQIIKSATSASANYRAACVARSKKEFFAKLCIVVEETDETQYWLEMLRDSNVKIDRKVIDAAFPEWTELLKIVTKAKHNTFNH